MAERKGGGVKFESRLICQCRQFLTLLFIMDGYYCFENVLIYEHNSVIKYTNSDRSGGHYPSVLGELLDEASYDSDTILTHPPRGCSVTRPRVVCTTKV